MIDAPQFGVSDGNDSSESRSGVPGSGGVVSVIVFSLSLGGSGSGGNSSGAYTASGGSGSAFSRGGKEQGRGVRGSEFMRSRLVGFRSEINGVGFAGGNDSGIMMLVGGFGDGVGVRLTNGGVGLAGGLVEAVTKDKVGETMLMVSEIDGEGLVMALLIGFRLVKCSCCIVSGEY